MKTTVARLLVPGLFVTTSLFGRSVPAPATTPLQAAVDHAVMGTLAEFRSPVLQGEQLAVTLVDLRGTETITASYRGDERFYPASVIKLFFLAAVHRGLEDGKIVDRPELRRAMKDMIVDSSNDATNYLVDVLTDTTGGPELPPAELAAWSEKRGAVTRYFESLGYKNVNAKRKTWGDGPYGRERQDMTEHPPARNYLSTNDTARLLLEIATGKCITPARSAEMLELMARDPFTPKPNDPDDQSVGFSGAGLTPGMKLWSKAGWVSWARHDAALIELPGGRRVIVVVFTDGREHANNRKIIPAVVKRILENLPK